MDYQLPITSNWHNNYHAPGYLTEDHIRGQYVKPAKRMGLADPKSVYWTRNDKGKKIPITYDTAQNLGIYRKKMRSKPPVSVPVPKSDTIDRNSLLLYIGGTVLPTVAGTAYEFYKARKAAQELAKEKSKTDNNARINVASHENIDIPDQEKPPESPKLPEQSKEKPPAKKEIGIIGKTVTTLRNVAKSAQVLSKLADNPEVLQNIMASADRIKKLTDDPQVVGNLVGGLSGLKRVIYDEPEMLDSIVRGASTLSSLANNPQRLQIVIKNAMLGPDIRDHIYQKMRKLEPYILPSLGAIGGITSSYLLWKALVNAGNSSKQESKMYVIPSNFLVDNTYNVPGYLVESKVQGKYVRPATEMSKSNPKSVIWAYDDKGKQIPIAKDTAKELGIKGISKPGVITTQRKASGVVLHTQESPTSPGIGHYIKKALPYVAGVATPIIATAAARAYQVHQQKQAQHAKEAEEKKLKEIAQEQTAKGRLWNRFKQAAARYAPHLLLSRWATAVIQKAIHNEIEGQKKVALAKVGNNPMAKAFVQASGQELMRAVKRFIPSGIVADKIIKDVVTEPEHQLMHIMASKFDNECAECGKIIKAGEPIYYSLIRDRYKQAFCASCGAKLSAEYRQNPQLPARRPRNAPAVAPETLPATREPDDLVGYNLGDSLGYMPEGYVIVE